MSAKFANIARWLIAGVFLYAGVAKALDPSEFVSAVGNYRLLPHAGAVAVALYLPWLEIVCGLAIFCRRTRASALAILGGLAAVFASAIGSAVWRGLDTECGCFSSGGQASTPTGSGLFIALLRSLLLASICMWLLRVETRQSVDPKRAGR